MIDIKQDVNVVGLIITLLLTGVAIVFRDSVVFAACLIIAAAVIGVLTVIRYAVSRKVRIIRSSTQAQNRIKEIYTLAASQGGEIHATHIFPRHEKPIQHIDDGQKKYLDLAIDELRATPQGVNVDFERILIVDNIDIEREWVQAIFEELKEKLNTVNLWVLERYPLIFDRLARSILPRANILLLRQGTEYYSLIGLDNLSGDASKALSFEFRSQSVYNVAKKYFSGITRFDEIISVKDKKEYTGRRFVESLPDGVHQIISAVTRYAENNPNKIALVGVFGSLAKQERGFHTEEIFRDEESDVDFLLVLTERDNPSLRADVKNELKAALTPLNADVIWGDDEEYFYHWRTEGSITVDIELRSLDSSFYMSNKLLGHSIFKYFLPLYSVHGEPIRKYLQVPLGPVPSHERFDLVLHDRKGLNDFAKRLSETPNRTDPRRVLSLVLRNVSWAESGHYPATTRLAFAHLQGIWKGIFGDVQQSAVQKYLAMNKADSKNNRDEISGTTLKAIESAKTFFGNSKP